MFDIGAFELLVIVVVAVLVIGPKDMPLALRTAGRWIGRVRRVSAHFRSGVDAMIREAELEEMEKKWQAQNEAIMAKTGTAEDYASDEMTGPVASAEEAVEAPPESQHPKPKPIQRPKKPVAPKPTGEPELPLSDTGEKD
jgi:sec-independent protein translocase protein TatB